MGVGGRSHAPIALPQGKRTVTIVLEFGWVSAPGTEAENLVLRGIRTPDRPARNVLYYIILYYIILYYIILYYIIYHIIYQIITRHVTSHHITSHNVILHYITLHYITLYSAVYSQLLTDSLNKK
jgi:hypothetical protein